ncbi:MAG: hypothetical protein R3286_14515 [Gammaproteobacteria bacterium]|nr:hypothetical protein [Gammaproteobacteria bacterium]
MSRAHLLDLLMIAIGCVLLAVGLGVLPGAELPSVRPFMLAGWVLSVVGGLRLSAALPARRAARAADDPRRTLIA